MATCTIDDCTKPVNSRGWCAMHYARWRKHGDPLISKLNRTRSPVCVVEGCGQEHMALGYCAKHYHRYRKHGDANYVRVRPRCGIDGCDRFIEAHGYCRLHRARIEKHGDPHYTRRTQFDCSIGGCDKPALARHLCGTHYARWRKHGDPSVNDRDARHAERAQIDWRDASTLGWFRWNPVGHGYLAAQWPEHPNASKGGRVAQHVAVMAAHLGRPLHKGETVHHKNGVRDDNRVDNLELWSKAHQPGQRVADLVAFAEEILATYGGEAQRALF